MFNSRKTLFTTGQHPIIAEAMTQSAFQVSRDAALASLASSPTPPSSFIPSAAPLPSRGPTSHTSQETYHPSSPRETSRSSSSATSTPPQPFVMPFVPEKPPLHEKTSANHLAQIQAIPEELRDFVERFVEFQHVRRREERELEKRAKLTPNAMLRDNEEENNVHPTYTTSGSAGETHGSARVHQDLKVCEGMIQSLKALQEASNDAGDRRCTYELFAKDAADSESLAQQDIAALETLIASVLKKVAQNHVERLHRSKLLFEHTQATLSENESEFLRRRQELARDILKKLHEMEQRLKAIEASKNREALRVSGQLGSIDSYDPEVSTLQRKSTQLQENLSAVQSQLVDIDNLRSKLATALGRNGVLAQVVGDEWLRTLTASSSVASAQHTPSSENRSPIQHGIAEFPPPAVALTLASVTKPLRRREGLLENHSQQQVVYDEEGKETARLQPVKRAREEFTSTSSAVEVERRTTATSAVHTQRPQPPTLLRDATVRPPTSTPARTHGEEEGGSNAKLSSQGQKQQQESSSWGIGGFFRAIIKRATTFDADIEEVVVEQEGEDEADSNDEPDYKRRRTEEGATIAAGVTVSPPSSSSDNDEDEE